MIAEPFDDRQCLGAISNTIAQMVADRDPLLIALATHYPTTRRLIEYIQSLPQRDDLGAPSDGPREYACVPTQRLRFGAPDPNCVERAALFIAVEEIRDPAPVRQLRTINTPGGLHTFPLVNGKPVVLNPKITRNCIDCAMALESPGPIAIEPRNAIAWTIDMAQAVADDYRNGPSTMDLAGHAIRNLVERGTIPSATEVDAMGALFALAERVARQYGRRALALVRTTARAIADVLDVILTTPARNYSFDIGGLKFSTPKWLDDGAEAVGKAGLDLGSLYLRTKLGLPAEIIGLLESRLSEGGLSLGSLAHPPALATFRQFAAPRTGGASLS